MERRGIRESGHARRDTVERSGSAYSLEAGITRGDSRENKTKWWEISSANYRRELDSQREHKDTRMLFGTMNKQRKRNTQLQIEAIEEYLLGMYAEGWTGGEAGD